MTSTVTTWTHRTTRETARALVGAGRGILAADESIGTMSSRLEQAGVAPTEENRRAYRELLVTTPGLHEGVSGVILCDETLRQRVSDGATFPHALAERGLLTGIKVDTGARPLAGAPGETVTEGLDGLTDRLAEYVELGAHFAKWRAVLSIGDREPSSWALRANAHALARYARSCQDAGICPIVEPEVLMDGTHSVHQSAAATAQALAAVVRALAEAGVDPAATVLKPNMVLSGSGSDERCTPEQIARFTVGTLLAVVPEDLAGVAFLSGGQSSATATANLAAIAELCAPWPLTFSFGRALVTPALHAWRGDPGAVATGQEALAREVRRNAAVLRADRSRQSA